ncbi:MAG TPA: hypothetical protein VJ742_08765 [Nitrososphaera sp.]|nr:hypothetical protein [Nitrososphaera sp.]
MEIVPVEIENLKSRVSELEDLCETLMRVLWDERGLHKGISGRIERELEPHWKRYLDRKNGGFPQIP